MGGEVESQGEVSRPRCDLEGNEQGSTHLGIFNVQFYGLGRLMN